MYPKLEHSKNYLVILTVFPSNLFSEPVELKYLASSFDISHSGASEFINQKGRKISSSFITQPDVTVSFRCYMEEEEFAVALTNIILDQEQVLFTVGRLANVRNGITIDEGSIAYEIIGYIRDAKISAVAGEFVIVDISINADDVNQFDPNNLQIFNPIINP